MTSYDNQQSWREYVMTTTDSGAFLLTGIASVAVELQTNGAAGSIDSDSNIVDADSPCDENTVDTGRNALSDEPDPLP